MDVNPVLESIPTSRDWNETLMAAEKITSYVSVARSLVDALPDPLGILGSLKSKKSNMDTYEAVKQILGDALNLLPRNIRDMADMRASDFEQGCFLLFSTARKEFSSYSSASMVQSFGNAVWGTPFGI